MPDRYLGGTSWVSKLRTTTRMLVMLVLIKAFKHPQDAKVLQQTLNNSNELNVAIQVRHVL